MQSTIKLQSNKTRRKANKTENDKFLLKPVVFLVRYVHKDFDEHLFSAILPDGRVIFSLRESVIETLSFSYILFADKLAKQITLCEAQ